MKGQGLSNQSVQILVENIDPTTIAGAQGVDVNSLPTDEQTIVVYVVDKTGSMAGYQNLVIDAYNEELQAVKDSKAADTIVLSVWLFDTWPTLLHGYLTLDQAQQFDRKVYDPDGLTALYDAVLDAFTGVVGYAETLMRAGNRVKVVVVVMTDGEDNSSRKTSAEVKTVATDLVNQEIYTLALVGFGGTDAKTIADSMGFPEKNVLTATSDPSSIRRALAQVSKSVIRTSQTKIASKAGGFFS